MSYRNQKFGHELWHGFFTAALNGLASTAYGKKDFNHKSGHDLDEIRDNIIVEAAIIADEAMEYVIRRAANDQAYADADDELAKERENIREGIRIYHEQIDEEHRREADLMEEFSEAELKEMSDG